MMTSALLSKLLFLAGVCHFFQIPAMLVAPRALGWKDDLPRLRPINRAIVIVLGFGMVLTIVGLGVVVMLSSKELANGGRLANALLCFLVLFWLYRAAVQVVVYTRLWPGNLRLAHYGLMVLFFSLTSVYAVVFFYGVRGIR
jgi:hypothetical protein